MAIRPIRTAEEWAASETKSGMDLEAAVGSQIRELRKIKKLTLTQLAQAAGISVGYLSQVERNQSKLPIGVLKKLSDALGVHMNWFFNGNMQAAPGERDIVVRKAHRRRLTFTGLGIAEELLSPNLAGPLELLLSTIEPGADSEEYSHDGNEAGIVIAGQLNLWVDGKLFQLEEGDSFSFSSTLQHRCANPGTVPAKVVWVITPPHY
ncbi:MULTISPECIES: helix-turn-helix domain-containing protein [unclassified Bradyrhizobium]|uniref:helix-turn-helix domain-containing protein n=1 Tax=unclassified Bradyrhizobium TaxID=2631580 RepID=UPI001CD4CE3B|nr:MULTISPECIES: XRE family transcriptional regulator [unclassified Bradyrhizobium]MCA1386138.1 cupin domain-containing protein [Bradyrhizobium sp. BRP05]MCA1394219.1 cupin domain-containing protein [Bradyrhizobium sp. IC3123]MCA1423678.1 cupin domain-containing protein [Bradyrhizobium sp. BRP23]MCA1430690.1 cupin domain-containing protein [Bradyrhizobium sp. NBAIM16]MCA1480287.1 cupin domain-containing protein [Bradyrhizobium sp. NBAIM08]